MVRRRGGSEEGGLASRGNVEAELSQRKLPHNLEVEESVLGALLVDASVSASVFQVLTPDDFYSPRHAKLFGVLQGLYDKHSTLDEMMALSELERLGLAESVGGMEFLGQLMQRVPTAANAEYYARVVEEKAILRALVGTCTGVIQSVYESNA